MRRQKMYTKMKKDKRRWLIVLLMGCWLMAGSFAYGQYADNEEEEGPGVILYKHAEFKGSKIFIKAGKNIKDLNKMGWNDIISSIKVFHGSGHRGYKKGVYDDEERVYCIFYKHANSRGSSFEGEPGYHRSIKSRWNDEISSLRIRRGYQVTLYEHGKFQGKRLVLTGKDRKGSVYNPDNYGFNDMVSSYKLVRPGRYHH
jgi:hypothetical protein